MKRNRKRRYRNVVAAVYGTVWALMPEKLAQICQLVDERAAGVQLTREEIRQRIGATPRPGDRLAGDRVAVLNLFGVIAQRMGMMEKISGGTSTEAFGKAFDEALADETVKAIVINVDSPGGSVPGTPELADKIFAARGRKPIVAVANPLMASAAYWIASAADKIFAQPSALVGSIGALAIHVEQSQLDAKAGIKRTIIASAKFKAEANPYEPLSETAQQNWQERVSKAGANFVAAVAKHRGVSAARVESDFGQGRIFYAADALAAGLIDRIATFEQVLSEFGVGAGTADNATAAAPETPAFSLERLTMDKRIFERLVQLGLCAIDATQAQAEAALKAFLAGRGFVGASGVAASDVEKILAALAPGEPAVPAPNAGGAAPTGQSQQQSQQPAAGGVSAAMSVEDILAAVALAPISAEAQVQLGRELVTSRTNLTTAQILDRISKAAAAQNPPTGATNLEATVAEQDKFVTSARDALLCREFGANLPAQIYDRQSDDLVQWTPTAGRRSHALQSLPSLGRRCLAQSGVAAAAVDRLHDSEVARILVGAPLRQFGVVASSDGPAYNVSGMFSNILLDAQNVILRRNYMEAKTTFQIWMRRGESIRDFKPVYKIIAGEVGDPKAIPEDGEFEETTLTDGKESYKLTVWGQIFSVTWQTIVNDQLQAFTRIPSLQGQAMRRKQNKLAYGVLKDNAALSDAGALFNSNAVAAAGGHNNLATGAATPTVLTLNAQYQRMAEMPGLEAGTVLNIEPSWILAPPALRGTVLELLGSTANPASGNANTKNIWENGLSPVIDAQLGAAAGGSDTAWYVAADVNDADTVEYAYLQGLETPALEQEVAFQSLAIRHRIYQAFAVKALGFRGLQKHTGAA